METEARSLLLGCGHSRIKQIQPPGMPEWTGRLTTLDMGSECGADIVLDLADHFEGKETLPLPFDDNTFDEMGAYNCMEHWGRQGDWKGYFSEFTEYHRILKPGGYFGIIVPVGGDALADPGHTRFFSVNHFGFLNQAFYERNEVKGTCFTDYRWFYKKNFDIAHMETDPAHIYVLLRKA